MQRHKIALYASGVAGLKDICTLLNVGADPVSTFQEYAEIIGNDLNGQPIEAGLPQATWTWALMPQADFEYLLAFTNAHVYIRTRNNSGASGFDFANYSCYASRPVGEFSEETPLIRTNVSITFVALVAV